MSLDLVTGDRALAYIESDEFESKWQILHASCPWATGCQHPGFVKPWYHIYRQRFVPVVLVEHTDDGSLAGLLTLALTRDGSRLTGAGDVQAEYQGWLGRAGTADRFMLEAIKQLRSAFPHAHISLKYLPPGIPLGWVGASADIGSWCALRSHPRPIMKIDAAAMERQRRKKNHRQNYNRLNRIGNVAFERVTENAHFAQVFDDICMQYDFRQAALYRHMPFSSDPLKKRFYLELHKRGMLHTTVLSVEDEVVASHVGLLTKESAVHLGINTYAPAFAAHSPGHLALALLGVHLASEQVGILDLTPGGDKYKEQFASEHDVAYELDIFGGPLERLMAQLLARAKRASKAVLGKAGWRGADVLEALEKVRRMGRIEPQCLLEKLRFRADPRRWVLSVAPGAARHSGRVLPISKNSLADVFRYDDAGSSVTLNAFIGTVMKRLERSSQLYSYAIDGKLAIYCWARLATAERRASMPGLDAPDMVGDVVLFDLYAHRHLGTDDLARRFLEEMLADLDKTMAGCRVFYSGPLPANLRTTMRRCGFSKPAVQPRGIR